MTRTYIELSAKSRQTVAMEIGLDWEAEGRPMTREEWLRSDDPAAMLRLATGRRSRCCGTVWCDNGDGTVSLAGGFRERPCCGNREAKHDRLTSDRKLRLLAIAVARHGGCGSWASVGHLIAAAESMADGQPHWLSERELKEAQPYAASWLVHSNIHDALGWVLGHCWLDPEGREAGPAQAAIFRDIIGDPFVPIRCRQSGNRLGTDTVAIRGGGCDCRWLTPEVLSLAEAVYTLRDSNGTLDPLRLSVLADCLVDAGCDDGHAILSHLRSGGPHYRGMWSLDLILGKA